jgi:BirA family biotin operon repressor/biotin-[acetyl-CoA-carboxylase] ligase
LIEIVNDSAPSVLTGIGINLVGAPQSATSIERESGKQFSPEQVASEVCPALHRAWEVLGKEGFKPFIERWSARSWPMGTSVSIEIEGRQMAGKFRGVAEDGQMILAIDGADRRFPAGHILGWELP